MSFDKGGAERAIAAFLSALGVDAEAPDLRGTPARVVDAFRNELLSGYEVDVPALLSGESSAIAGEGECGVVAVRGIRVATVCPHHLLVGTGRADVAYLPGQALVGIGTIARVVDAYARRLTLQEAIGDNVVRALMDHAGARGAICRLTFHHTCLMARGARQADAEVVTLSRIGATIPESALGGGVS